MLLENARVVATPKLSQEQNGMLYKIIFSSMPVSHTEETPLSNITYIESYFSMSLIRSEYVSLRRHPSSPFRDAGDTRCNRVMGSCEL